MATEDRFLALATELSNQGLLGPDPAPVSQLDYAPELGTPPVRLFWSAGATQAQKDSVNAIIAGWDWQNRRARLLYDIRTDINNLSAAQKTNVSNDLFGGTPPKFTGDRGPNAAALLTLWTLLQTGLSAADKTLVRVSATAIYVLDQPKYLVKPTFDLTINIAGDEVIP